MRCRAALFIRYWLPPIFFQLVIFYLSGRPFPKILPRLSYIDKFVHITIYFILTSLLWRALYYASPQFLKNKALVLALILAIISGITDEYHQSFLPYRNADIFDILSDTIGAFIFIIGLFIWNYRKKVTF